MSRHSLRTILALAATVGALVWWQPGLTGAQERALERATFGGGCFWCMEPPFDKLKGVVSTTSGYTGGHVKNPTYEQVSSGRSGHVEVVQVVFDPAVVSYDTLLDVFWKNVDPLDDGGQFCDRGQQYRTVIYYHSDAQRRQAEVSKRKVQQLLSKPIVTPIEAAQTFYPAEEYHQDYYQKNPVRYNFYRWNCGRDNRLEEVWG
jgi:peptide-methionine (S)-S-oxide reductase